jgi:hypothetical protein
VPLRCPDELIAGLQPLIEPHHLKKPSSVAKAGFRMAGSFGTSKLVPFLYRRFGI